MTLETPSRKEFLTVFARIGCLSFGGPAAQIALMHRELVEVRPWLDDHRFINALSFCMLLPGPEAMQLATYCGWRLRGVTGGLAAGLLFVLPGALLIALLAALYSVFGNVPFMQALFLGVKAAVLVVVIEALWKVSKRALHRPAHYLIAALTFVALFVFNLPFPLIILAAGLWGYCFGAADVDQSTTVVDSNPDHRPIRKDQASVAASLRTALCWLLIWLIPVLLLELLLPGSVYGDIARFFSLLAAVTFGGAYAVLSYMAQVAVEGFAWLDAAQMADALGLAETTPGPLILVTEFVAFLAAAWSDGGSANVWQGLIGAAIALWVTFVPCFLWVFVGAPWIEHLQHMTRLRSALTAITAAVVGVMLNLSVWFALSVGFATVERRSWGPLQPWIPDFSTLDWRIPLLTTVAAILLLKLRWDIVSVLLSSALAGVLLVYLA